MADNPAPLERADLLVGRFFRYFGAIEVELNDAIRKLFELTPANAETVCANIDFFRKLHIVRSALTDQDATGEHKEKIKKLFSRIADINNRRLVAAHANFESNDSDGVVFHRVTATTGLQRNRLVWTESDCAYHASLDFSDPRNSMYLAML
jgi:hypothetical protein